MFLFLSFVLVIYLINISPYHHFVNTLYLFQCVGSLVTFLNLRETILCRRHFFFQQHILLYLPQICALSTPYMCEVWALLLLHGVCHYCTAKLSWHLAPWATRSYILQWIVAVLCLEPCPSVAGWRFCCWCQLADEWTLVGYRKNPKSMILSSRTLVVRQSQKKKKNHCHHCLCPPVGSPRSVSVSDPGLFQNYCLYVGSQNLWDLFFYVPFKKRIFFLQPYSSLICKPQWYSKPNILYVHLPGTVFLD